MGSPLDRSYPGRCYMCNDETTVRKIDLYVIGSEGLAFCHDCEMEVVEFVRGRITTNSMAHTARCREAVMERRRAANNVALAMAAR